MNNLAVINNKQLKVKEFNGKRVVTFKDIDYIHERPEGTASRNFSQNKFRFIEGEDYFHLSKSEIENTKIVNYSSPKGLTILTESGYLMLVKSLTDDLSWGIQKKIVDSYFRAKDLLSELNGLSPQLQFLIQMELKQKQLEEKLETTQTQITDIKDTIVNREEDWRKEVGRKLRKIGLKHGDYKTFVDESYKLLQERARCNLKQRLENLRSRMALNGSTRTAIDKANYLDAIQLDTKLKEIYINIVNQLYIKHAA